MKVQWQKSYSGNVLLVEAEKRHHIHQVGLSKHLKVVLESQALDPMAVKRFLVNTVLVTELGLEQSSPSKGSFCVAGVLI